MEKLFYNLSEEELTTGRKVLLWTFVAAFFLGGIWVAIASPVFGIHHIKPVLCLAPFGISLIVGLIAAYATIKREDLYFMVDEQKIEFRYGIFKPKKNTILWNDVKELVMPHKDKLIKVNFKDGRSQIINLSYIQKKKSTHIRKHIFHESHNQGLEVIKVIHLQK
jgi:hypothetical protein